MKTYILFLLNLFALNIANAQVGINTNTPTKSLDINGDFRLRTLNKVTITDYPDVLVVNNDGDVEKHSAQAIKDAISDLTVETKELYFDTSPDGSKIVPCGRFNFRFSDTTIPQVSSVTNLATAATINYLGQLKYDGNNKTVTQRSINIQTTNGFQSLDTSYALNRVGEYYMSFPDDNNFYRVVFIARKMTASSNSYSIVCEKF